MSGPRGGLERGGHLVRHPGALYFEKAAPDPAQLVHEVGLSLQHPHEVGYRARLGAQRRGRGWLPFVLPSAARGDVSRRGGTTRVTTAH